MYRELASWFHVLTPPEHYTEEAADYAAALRGALPEARTLLELGSGGGNNASHMKAHFTMTLSDLSPEMLAESRKLNPELEHIEGDMRTLRLGRTFDAVFVHDAIEYMDTPEKLREAVATAFVHTRPGGVALFVPDGIAETFRDGVDDGGEDAPDGRSLRYFEWTLPPKPGEKTYEVHFAILTKDGDTVTVHHDIHHHALFSRADWEEILSGAGFELLEADELDPEIHEEQVLFLVRRPLT
ncbi:MAG: class I SAM-dependent methyltransferase [Dehalococcoidia bacterium]